MERKRKILILTDWYLPGFRAGGPIRSCANIVAHLGKEFDFSIVASDTDFGAASPYPNVTPDIWSTTAEGHRVFYFSAGSLASGGMKNLLCSEGFDAIYLNSLFSKKFTIDPLRILKRIKPEVKIILAPRGMLGPGALSIKPLKKKTFLTLSKITGLYDDVTWHASTEIERDEIKHVFGDKARVMAALNLPSLRTIERVKRVKECGKFDMVFLSRISVKKNLRLAIRFLGSLDKKFEVTFDIYGSKEDPLYWNGCEQEMRNLSSNSKITYKGVIENSDVQKVLQKYHCSILPTAHENYGHSIVESMAAGCPVIISDQTPWRNLEARKAGWDVSLKEPEKFVNALDQMAGMHQAEFDQWSAGAYDLAQSVFEDKKALEENRKLFLK